MDQGIGDIWYCVLSPHQQIELQQPEDDWSGITDPVRRKKLQNRLHQRAWRRRQAALRRRSDIKSVNAETQGISQSGGPSMDQLITGWSICGTKPTISSQGLSKFHRLSQFEKYVLGEYMAGSPRADLLLSLVRFNVFRALMDNNSSLGFSLEWLDCDAISPFYKSKDHSALILSNRPNHLRPTTLQQTVEHHPWIDLFPIPQLRDNILRAGDDYDDNDICRDLVENQQSPGEMSGLIVWGNPWSPESWEVSEECARKWSWVFQGCQELFISTNYWRARRGEKKLFPNA